MALEKVQGKFYIKSVVYGFNHMKWNQSYRILCVLEYLPNLTNFFRRNILFSNDAWYWICQFSLHL